MPSNSQIFTNVSNLIPDFPIIDLRPLSLYQIQHLAGSTHLPWPELQQRLNELPSRPADLQLVGASSVLSQAKDFLQEKGYRVIQQIDTELTELDTFNDDHSLATGNDSRRLWQPSSLVKEFIDTLMHDDQSENADKTALDIGCGGGRDAVYLSEHGWQVTAIDQQASALKRAQQLAKHYHQSIQFLECDLNQENCLPDKQFDLIIIIRYLNRNLMSWIRSHLAEEGVLIFQTFIAGIAPISSPKNPNFLLNEHELAKTFADFEIIIDRIDTIKDGRPVASFIAKKKGSKVPC